ncbi:hypothetical protein HZC27_03600 [Candidatus Roizmanbacteria bacterium]|nr:hypothetical protein [Candidatus Roizmanbacteria bacterium]
MDYYKAIQYLAVVDREDNIIGKMEKWEAHKKGVLHRGYTAILEFENNIILQHRKHPVFDGVYDLSFSSHEFYQGVKLQPDEEAIYEGLKREWGVDKFEIRNLKFLNTVYYKEKDIKSDYFEHEIDYIYVVELNKMPTANPDFAYGQKVISKATVASDIAKLGVPLAPWVEKILDAKLIP